MEKEQKHENIKENRNSISGEEQLWKMLLVLIFAVGTILRILMSWKHFTHYDDVGLITSLCRLGQKFTERLNYRDIGWTYAPFQVGMISLLIDKKWGYTGNIILGRLPSLIFSVINIGLIAYLLLKRCKNKFAALFAIVLLTFSWENIIYASQAEPYAIGVTAMLICMILYFRIIDKKKINVIMVAAISAWECYASYQMFMYVFVLYLSLFILFTARKDIKELIKSIISSILAFIICIPLLMNFRAYSLLGRSVNWNIGNQGQFFFQIENAENKLTYFINFFVRNTVTLIRSFFVYKEKSFIVNAFAFLILAAILAGIIYINYKEHSIALFIDICLFFTCIMILTGKLTCSPSRHMLVFEPILLFLSAMGIEFFIQLKRRKADILAKLIYGGTLVGIIAIFMLNFQTEFKLRKNNISEKMVCEMIEEYNPIFITFYRGTFDLDLMQIENYDKMLAGGIGTQCIKKSGNESLQEGDCVIFFSRAAAIQAEDLEEIRDLIGSKELKLMEKNEFAGDTEVEYAKGEFSNYKNDSYMYIYKAD